MNFRKFDTAMKNWKPATEPVDVENFQKVILAYPFVVVHFWADWNSLIEKKMDIVLSKVRPKFVGVAVYSFDVGSEEAWAICRQFGILTLPTLLCFSSGQLQEVISGCRSAEELEAKFAGWKEDVIRN